MSPSTKLSTDYSDVPSSKLPDLTGRYIGAGRYKLLKKIGQGSFGIVYLGQNTQTDPRELVAVKCSVEGRNTSIRLEIDLQARAGAASSGVLGIHEVVEDEDWELTFIVTDYCPDGDLFDLIYDKSKRFFRNDERIRSTFLQILDGVASCHAQGIYHRDLKPENILCVDGGKRVALTDFGFATGESYTSQFGMGTEAYMSPEVQGGLDVKLRCYSSAQADIWALGVILLNLVTGGEFAWKSANYGDNFFFHYIMNEPDYLAVLYPLSQELNDILKCIFTTNPRNRISLSELRVRIVSLRHFKATSSASGASLAAMSSAMEVVEAPRMGKGKGVERTMPENNRLLSLHELLVANIGRSDSFSFSSTDSVSFEPLRDDNHMSIGPQQWPSELGPANISNASMMSQFLGGDDIDSITRVERLPARRPLTVMNPSPPSTDSDSSSDYDSEYDDSESESDDEAITPETHAVDAATTTAAGDVPDFDLDQSAPTVEPATAKLPVSQSDAALLELNIPAAKMVGAPAPWNTRTAGTYSAGQNMLMVAARRMRMRRTKAIAIATKV